MLDIGTKMTVSTKATPSMAATWVLRGEQPRTLSAGSDSVSTAAVHKPETHPTALPLISSRWHYQG